ncbi:MAG: ShlB/FhaC/HecB family hemolysin secretion/activation protein [Sulfuricurvum sp.]|uniref:ShlB/FhaC/HecB family hemolysin secretion/activation protein n=1 Tax=Sulfuricurvum sp. TaxID=2025608 RepID=UPI00261FA4EA|nr:ShlB/FhaC/HecB family hemolysin secretion/activation protein [Sulfuricurvum sp.]MDD2370031.1 ShlB/FhaC/HecB family hemolysin secretion/activation protein [Sulfuricurvum sp.]MDD5118837.1 ShlB/FhaC/HecB family hemolysin secretion/activation protein [Sulfuricurvum sp.]
MQKIITLSLISISLLFSAPVTIPNSSNILREVQPPQDLPQSTIPLVEIGGVHKYAPAMLDDKSGKTLHVAHFKITGATHIDEQKLLNLISSYKDKNLTFNQLQEAAEIITKEYRQEGYLVARAYIPVQDMHNEVLEIAVIEGHYGEFYLKNRSNVQDSRVQAILDEAKKDDAIRTNTLERSLLIINDTPGIEVTQADIKPGKEVGTSDFDVTVDPSKRYDGYVLGDNYGSRYTGYNRVMVGLNLNALAGIGDKLSFNGIVSSGSNLKNGSIYYAVPLLPNGLTAQIGYVKTTYVLSQEYASLAPTGNMDSLEATLSYPIIRTREHTMKVSSTASFKHLKDYQQDQMISNKHENTINLSFSDLKNTHIFGYSAQISSGATFTVGNLKFIDDTSKNIDTLGVQTAGNFSKIGGFISVTTLLPKEFSLQTKVQVQKALGHKNLDGSEDMSIGGINGVKLFPDSELSAENGVILNLGLFKELGVYKSLTNKLGVFYDAGTASLENTSSDTTFKSRTLQDIGLGYFGSYQSFFAKAELARSVGGSYVTSEPRYTTRGLVQLGWIF